jgi:hypothetical protein
MAESFHSPFSAFQSASSNHSDFYYQPTERAATDRQTDRPTKPLFLSLSIFLAYCLWPFTAFILGSHPPFPARPAVHFSYNSCRGCHVPKVSLPSDLFALNVALIAFKRHVTRKCWILILLVRLPLLLRRCGTHSVPAPRKPSTASQRATAATLATRRQPG